MPKHKRHLFDQIYSKNSKTVKYHYNLKISVLNILYNEPAILFTNILIIHKKLKQCLAFLRFPYGDKGQDHDFSVVLRCDCILEPFVVCFCLDPNSDVRPNKLITQVQKSFHYADLVIIKLHYNQVVMLRMNRIYSNTSLL